MFAKKGSCFAAPFFVFYRLPLKIRIFVQGQGVLKNNRRHLVDIFRIIFLSATRPLGKKTILKVAYRGLVR